MQNDQERPGAGTYADFDPSFWTEAEDMTVGALREFLSKFPDDATVHCCGAGTTYWHYAPETKALSVDCEDLAELPEYAGRSPSKLGA